MSFNFSQKKIIWFLVLIFVFVSVFGNIKLAKAYTSSYFETQEECNTTEESTKGNYAAGCSNCKYNTQAAAQGGKGYYFECYANEQEKTANTSSIGGGNTSWEERTVAWVLGWILYGFFLFTSWIFTFVGNLFDAILTVHKFTDNVPAVRTGWEATLGLVNLFFALALLIIAFATILRLETYGVKKALPWLIIIALLINFSWTISGAIIDFSQVTMKAMLSSGLPQEKIGESISANIVGASSAIGKLFKVDWRNPKTEANMELIAQMFFLNILVIGLTVAFGIVGGMLIVRIIALWILLILAPLAWFCLILPGTKKMWDAWWSSFLKYVIYGPAAVFFIWLTVMVANPSAVTSQVITDQKAIEKLTGLSGWLADKFEPLINYVFILILMFGTFIVARYLGVAGAATSMGVAKWFGKGGYNMVDRFLARRKVPGAGLLGKWGLSPLGGAIGRGGTALSQKRGFGWIGRGITGLGKRIETGGKSLEATKLRGIFSPGAWQRGWTARQQRVTAESFAEGAGTIQDFTDVLLSLGKEYHHRNYRAQQQLIGQKLKELQEIGDTSQGFLIETLKSGIRKGKAGEPEAKAALLRLVAQADEERLFEDPELHRYFGKFATADALKNGIIKLFGDDINVKRYAGSVSFAAKGANMPIYDHMVKYDERGNLIWNSREKQGEGAAFEAGKKEPQERSRFFNRRNWGISDEKGDMVGLDIGQQEILLRLDFSDAQWSNQRMPPSNKQWINEKIVNNFANAVENGWVWKDPSGVVPDRKIVADKAKADMIRLWIKAVKSPVVMDFKTL